MVSIYFPIIIRKYIGKYRCDVTKRDELVTLYEGCELHFGAKVTISISISKATKIILKI